jgi:hypothetical protein
MSHFIPPPFPFPDQWKTVNEYQTQTGDVKWLVPNPSSFIYLPYNYWPIFKSDHTISCYDQNNFNGYSCFPSYNIDEPSTSKNSLLPVPVPIDSVTEEQGLEGYEEEVLVLNDEWAIRLSKTVKRMKQKIHKSRRKAAWKSKC